MHAATARGPFFCHSISAPWACRAWGAAGSPLRFPTTAHGLDNDWCSVSIEDRTDAYDEPLSDALPSGSKLLSGQYEILRYLSSGGFGITYLAKDSLNRTVVIKECFPDAFCKRVNNSVRARTQSYIEDFRSTVQLFIKEAHALSKLKHPSVVGVHQVFEDHETAYMALDLIDGQDLLEIIETGVPKLPPEAIRKLTLKLLDAIAHVHGQDLLHRDISPDNILVDKTGHPVLIDFGAAREEASRKSRVLSSVMVVKDGYSPQEFYVAGSQQQPCSDLYALAATLVHLITGEAPPNSHARLAALASKKPDPYRPLSGRISGYDTAFLELIDKAMSVAPDERPQSAEEWVLSIDHAKRLELARAHAQSDVSIDQTVMALVRSERQSLATARQRPPLAHSDSETSQPAQPVATPRPDTVFMQPATELIEFSKDQPAPLFDGQREETVDVATETATATEVEKPTPYVRVTSRALDDEYKKAQSRQKPRRVSLKGVSLQRVATAPIVFGAYFFYAHTAFQYEQVRAYTIIPLVEFGEELSALGRSDAHTSPRTVVVRRGLGD